MKHSRTNGKTTRRTTTRSSRSTRSTSSTNAAKLSTLRVASNTAIKTAMATSKQANVNIARSTSVTISQSSSNTSSSPSIVSRRNYTLGKHYKKVQAEQTALKKVKDNEILSAKKAEEQAAYEAREQARQARQPSALELKTELISAIDLPRHKNRRQEFALQNAADSGLNFTPTEVNLMLTMCNINHSTNARAAATLIQSLIKRDYVPEEPSLRGLVRLFESNFQWKSANEAIDQLDNLYPKTQYDEVGFPIPKEVLTKPIPDFTTKFEPSDVQQQPYDLKSLLSYIDKLKTHDLQPRFETVHFLINYYLKQKELTKAAEVLFRDVFHRVGIHEIATVPQPFDAVEFHAQYKRTIATFNPDINLYYNMADAFIANKNWAAAMQTLVYVRCFLRHLDVTPLREITSAGYTRDYLDLHMHNPDQAAYVVRQLLAELRVRRGYKQDMEAKLPGTEDAKSFIQFTKEHHITYSPLIATENQPLVILTDRSYNHRQDVIQLKGGLENTNAHAIHKAFTGFGIKSELHTTGSALSGSSQFYLLHKELTEEEAEKIALNPEQLHNESGGLMTEKEIAKECKMVRDLTVSVSAAELDRYGDFGPGLFAKRWNDLQPTLPRVNIPLLAENYPKPKH